MFHAASQNVDLFRLILLYLLVLEESGWRSAAESCHEVKAAYMMRQIGPVDLLPDTPATPATDQALRVCLHSGPSCCTTKMEDSYMAAVRSETQQKMRSFSFELQYLISGHIKAYQETFQSFVSFTSNLTGALFDSAYAPLASDCRPLVLRLFNAVQLHLSGRDGSSLDGAVRRFYSDLFPLVYRRLLNPGVGRSARLPLQSANHDDCLRLTQPDVSPFGPHPHLLAGSLSRALRHGRALSRLLRLAEEVLNATEKVTLSRECGRGLVRMQYCSHCRGLTLLRPCAGLCVNVMRGCLVAISEVGAPWGDLVVLLQRLAATLATSSNHNSLELALLAVRNHVNDAVLHAQLHGPRISATVEKVCGPQAALPTAQRAQTATPRTLSTVAVERPHVTLPAAGGRHSHQRLRAQSDRTSPGSRGDQSRSLKKLSREFSGSIQRYRFFFSELPEMLCETEVEQHTCWSGQEVVESYAGRVVGATLKAQRDNPEVNVRSTDPVLKGVQLKLEQVIQEVALELGWTSRETKESEEEEGGSTQTDGSGGDDCDDEDGCEESGDETDDASSGHKPGRQDMAPPPPARRPAPPHHISPSGSVGASAHRVSVRPVTLVTSLLLLISRWEPR